MADENTLSRINELADEEHALRAKQSAGEAGADDRERLEEIGVLLDQCWDLLRQRRAHREFGQDPDQSSVRPADVVENYEN
jgi:hypothetical protein